MQKLSDDTVAATLASFYKQVKTLHLDIHTREAVNNNARGEAFSTVVRVYQLKDRKAFDATDYPSLFAYDSQLLKTDLLDQKDLHLRPVCAVTADMPMEEKARYVSVAGMSITPAEKNDAWRAVLSRDELDPNKARIIEAGNIRLTLKSVKDN